MHVDLKRIDNDFHFNAKGLSGINVDIDASPAIGGHNAGSRPMELMLMSLGSCSAIDIIQILKKQRQDLIDISISIDGNREADKVPSLFTDISVHYTLKGTLEEDKVKRAIELSIEKYCSAAETLRKTAVIKYSFSIIT